MAGSQPNREPKEWAKPDTTKSLVEVLQDQHVKTGGISPSLEVLKTKEGRGGGTWAVRGLALAYAKYLSPQFHVVCRVRDNPLARRGTGEYEKQVGIFYPLAR